VCHSTNDHTSYCKWSGFRGSSKIRRAVSEACFSQKSGSLAGQWGILERERSTGWSGHPMQTSCDFGEITPDSKPPSGRDEDSANQFLPLHQWLKRRCTFPPYWTIVLCSSAIRLQLTPSSDREIHQLTSG
jgi:hypothetical protein